MDAISAVVRVIDCERLVPDGKTPTPDWRLTLADGRVADVEVTTCVNPHKASLEASTTTKGKEQGFDCDLLPGNLREWPSDRLSYRWIVTLGYHDRASEKQWRSVREMVNAAISLLAEVEAQGGPPERMAWEARISFIDRYWPDDADPTRSAAVFEKPEHRGEGQGCVMLDPVNTAFFTARELADDVQTAITKKTAKRQMDDAPGLRWLAVMVDGTAALTLTLYPDHEQELRGIQFDYFDEVWVCSLYVPVVLRLSNGGSQTMVHWLNR